MNKKLREIIISVLDDENGISEKSFAILNQIAEQDETLHDIVLATDAFDDTAWHYVYLFNYNRKNEQKKSLVVHFDNDVLKTISGDFELPETFNTPLEKQTFT